MLRGLLLLLVVVVLARLVTALLDPSMVHFTVQHRSDTLPPEEHTHARTIIVMDEHVGCLIHSPPDVVSCYVRNTSPCSRAALSRSLRQAEGQRAECVLMTGEQKGAAIRRPESKFTGRERGEAFLLQLHY
ncbi:hypothetical protein F7725_017188 [Dissostichus mawsoni]|uniref:Secreted protein n=1 Tax=Dissostichus mawsoni TaxID=36200 RepID=A0A7J5Z3Q2_DISMA|nr:hypothetical protein F7725_017188 [Dissostichus mawsoni]